MTRSEHGKHGRHRRRWGAIPLAAFAIPALFAAACVRRPEESTVSPPPVRVVVVPADTTHPAPTASAPPTPPVSAAPESCATTRPALAEPPPVTRELRGVWVSPVADSYTPDWPSRPGLSSPQQQAELRALLDRVRDLGLNAVFLHVRTAADALYPTPLAPWSAFLSGRSGVPPQPAYDPLAFAIAEAHARGIQLHAWFNPFRAMLPNLAHGAAAASHVTRAHPAWIRHYGTQTWIDPGEPAARAAVLETMLDVARRYDVDGIHLDDYFYPYRESETTVRRVRRHGRRVTVRKTRELEFPDERTWKKYGRGHGFASRADWRRANIDDLVHSLYTRTKAIKPWLLVGISPFGIWRPGSPPGIEGLDSYAEIYADSRKWLREGWVDYLAPQLYWTLDGAEERFLRLDRWWLTQNPHGRHVWPGLYTEGPFDKGWDRGELAAQVVAIRASHAAAGAAPGEVHFRYGALTAARGLGDALRASVYGERALVPEVPDAPVAAGRAAAPRVEAMGAGVVTVAPADTATTWWLVRTRARDGRWSSSLLGASSLRPLAFTLPDSSDEVAVTGVDRWGRLGAPAEVALGGAAVGGVAACEGEP